MRTTGRLLLLLNAALKLCVCLLPTDQESCDGGTSLVPGSLDEAQLIQEHTAHSTKGSVDIAGVGR